MSENFSSVSVMQLDFSSPLSYSISLFFQLTNSVRVYILTCCSFLLLHLNGLRPFRKGPGATRQSVIAPSFWPCTLLTKRIVYMSLCYSRLQKYHFTFLLDSMLICVLTDALLCVHNLYLYVLLTVHGYKDVPKQI